MALATTEMFKSPEGAYGVERGFSPFPENGESGLGIFDA